MTHPEFPVINYFDLYGEEIGDELYTNFLPLVETWGDPDDQLWLYLHALGAMLQPIDDMCKDWNGPPPNKLSEPWVMALPMDRDGAPGWSQVLDLDRAKTDWLKWLGQWVGFTVPDKSDYEDYIDYGANMRTRIYCEGAHNRGTVNAIIDAMEPYLDSTDSVIIRERVPTANTINVWVNQGDVTGGFEQVETAARLAKAAGLIMNFTLLVGNEYAALRAHNATYAILRSKHATYQDMSINPSK